MNTREIRKASDAVDAAQAAYQNACAITEQVEAGNALTIIRPCHQVTVSDDSAREIARILVAATRATLEAAEAKARNVIQSTLVQTGTVHSV